MIPLVEAAVLHEPDRKAAALLNVPVTACWSNPLEDPDWDPRTTNFGDHCFFHSAAWLRVIQESYGFRPMYLELRSDHRPGSLIPVMEVNTLLTGKRGVSLPFTDFCPPLVTCQSNEPAELGLLREVIHYGKSRGWRYYECRGGRFDGIQPSLSFYEHRLNLNCSEQSLFSGFKGRVRQAIRKAEREGVQVQLSNTLASVQTFYGLHCQTRRKHGLPPQPFAFFRSLHLNVLSRDLGFVAIATCQQRPIAGAVFCHLGKNAMYKFSGSLEAFQRFCGNNLVLWEAIKWYTRNGFASLSFGRTSLQHDGLRRFKLGWGTTESVIDYFKYDLRKNAFVAEHDKANGWHNRVFSLLPVAASRWIGALLYREFA